jgi:sugar lactone lactonase YvrE
VAATDARLQPKGMAFDAAGRLHMADLNRVRRIDAAGVITTVAGDGTYGFSGDGGPATSAQVVPADVAFDGAGNLFIADRGNDRIRKVTPDGVIRTVAGNGYHVPVVDGGPATDSALSYPDTVAVRDGSIYVNGTNNRSVRRIDPAGTITTIAGDGEYGADGDGGPALAASLQAYDLAFDAEGNLYMADWFNNRLRRLRPDGILDTAAGNGTFSFGGDGGPALEAQVSGGTRMAFDGSGNLFVADIANDVVRRVDSSGTITTVARVDFAVAGAIAFDPGGRLHIAESGKNRVVRLEPSGALTVVAGGRYGDSGDGGPAADAAMLLPSAIDFDAAGNLFVVDFDSAEWHEYARIRKVDPAGTITTVVGPTSAYGRSLAMCHGGDLAVEPSGRLLVTDKGGVLRVDQGGGVTRIAGGGAQAIGDGGPAIDAQLFCTGGVAVDGAGNVYIGDSDHQRVRRVGADGTITTVAGGGDRFPGDGGPATSAQLFLADGFGDVELDSSGDLYVGAAGPLAGHLGSIRRVELPGSVPPPTPTSPASTSTSTSTTSTSTSTTTSSSTTTTSTTTSSTTPTTPASTTTTTVPLPVKAWGLNNVGELGTGTATDSRVPVPSAAPPGARGVTAGFYHSLTVDHDGTCRRSGGTSSGSWATGRRPTPARPSRWPGSPVCARSRPGRTTASP